MATNQTPAAMAPEPTPGTEPPGVFPPARVQVASHSPRTDVVQTPVEFFILGPRRSPDEPAIWAVRARLLQWATDAHGVEDPWYSRACRQLFVDRRRPASPAPQALLPGMLVARCRILTARISINGLAFDYAGPANGPVDVDLLLHADDADWSNIQLDDSDAASRAFSKVHLNEAVCLAGEIPFDAFVVHPDAPANQPSWASRFATILGQVGHAALSSSGLAFEARAILPWSKPGAASISKARYLAEVALPPDGQPTPTLVVLPDLDRLDDPPYRQARPDFLEAFASLAAMLQPEPSEGASTRNRPRWVGLEPTGGAELPGFSWIMTSGLQGQSPANSFRFDAGAWRLALTDQPSRVAGVSPRGVLSADAILDIPYNQADPSSLAATVSAGPPAAVAGAPSTLQYTLTRQNDGYHETIAIADAVTTYDPIAAAQLLRAIAAIPEPQLEAADPPTNGDLLAGSIPPTTTGADGKVVPQVLFGVMPLEDGWAQLPFLNATDQILTDILPEPPLAGARTSLFAGAASFGTDRAELFDPSAGEPGWNVTVLDADDFRGTWSIKDGALVGVVLGLSRPELSLEGLFWLATAPPTAEDALPTLDDWLGAIQSLPLRTPDPTDLYPSPFVVKFHDLTFAEGPSRLTTGYSTASLATIEFSYAANETSNPSVYDRIFGQPGGIFDPDTFWHDLPLAWRRHGKAPAIQSLPLTQSKTPPNDPSASRQLFPFALALDKTSKRPGDWTFRTEGGASWPKLKSPASSAIRGEELDGLALLALGLPGLAFDPNAIPSLFTTADPDDRILPAQYRHEMALLDEVNALATLPKEDKPPQPGEAPLRPPPGLRRGDYGAFWAHLADLAFFATAEARDALVLVGGRTVVRGLIEPFDWQATASLAAAPYPGSITFQDPNARGVTLSGTASDALRGIEGSFRRTATAGRIELVDVGSAEFTVVGEAMAAALDSAGRIRDQRGLYREASTVVATASPNWIATRVGLLDDPAPAVLLWTAMAPLTLSAPSSASWNFWARDLPAVDGGATSTFDRSAGQSTQRRGENDPAAPNRTLNHLNGYEWRLGSPDRSPLPLGPLWFFPLSIEAAKFDPVKALTSVTFVGRLHLPFPKDKLTEPEDRSNAVRVTFDDGALSAVAIAPPDFDGSPPPAPVAGFNDWPLADPSASSDAPVFRWTSINLEGKTSLVVTGQVVYVRHGVSWTFPSQDITIPLDGSPPTVQSPGLTPSAGSAISIQSATLALDFSKDSTKPTGHSFTARWQFTWGEPEQLQLVATYDEPVLAQSPPAGGTVVPGAFAASLMVRNTPAIALSLQDSDTVPPNLDGGAVQVQWSGIEGAAGSTSEVQVLPGFHLSDQAARAPRGFAVLAFDRSDRPGDLPLLDLPRGGYLEALFGCDWGLPLQAPLPGDLAVGDLASKASQRVFGSSAGRIDAAYTATFVTGGAAPPPHRWTPRLLLSGFVEVKDLASWPTNLVPDASDNLVTLPAARPASPATAPGLGHVRHTARVLFNQHVVPVVDLFEPGRGAAPILLTLKAGGCWTTRAVVEHQFARVDLDASAPPVVTGSGHDARLTLVQEVRFCAPSAFRGMLDELAGLATTDAKFPLAGAIPGSQSTNVLLRFVPGAARGYLSRSMMGRFAAGPKAVVDLGDEDTMIVEASVPAMVRTDPATKASPSSLDYLPGGTTRAYLAALTDYQSARDDPRDAPVSWTMLPLTFLGRMQPRGSDGLPTAAPPPAPAQATQPSTLRVDPVLQIALGRSSGFATLDPVALTLANWMDREALSIGLAEFDLARHRRFTRLDPSSLREGWFRLHLPFPTTPSTAPPGSTPPVDTVLAGAPADENGAMGRPEVVARLLDPRRPGLPPDAGHQPGPPDVDDPATIEWHPDGLFLFDLAGSTRLDGQPGLSGRVALDFGFLGVGAQLAQAGLVPDGSGLVRRPAATILPARSSFPGPANVQPLSTAVSPYLGLEFDPAVAAGPRVSLVLALSELVCFDVARRQVISIASKLWNPTAVSGPLDALIRAWGREIQSRLAADSPSAVIRLREVHGNPPPGNGSGPSEGVTVVYRFLASEPVVSPPSPARRAPALRAQPASIRYPQGQYGGPARPPEALAPFEVAPPQVVGVQPLRLGGRPGASGGASWPWGLSAYRLSVLQSGGGVGVAGPPMTLPEAGSNGKSDGRMWWQSLHHAVQYAVPDGTSGRRILPTLFRARALPGLLPTWPSSPLPAPEDLKTALEAQDDAPTGSQPPIPASALTGWQPVLPGGHVVLLAGARPGAPFAFRESIQTQDLGAGRSVVSGSVPVMHRFPRPVLLPPNDSHRPEVALQTSAGAFALETTVDAQPSPADSAYLDINPNPIGLDLILAAPDPGPTGKSITGGTIPAGPRAVAGSNWDGTLRFQADGHGIPLVTWFPTAPVPARVSLQWTDPRTGVSKTFTFQPPTGLVAGATSGTVAFEPDLPADLAAWLDARAHGDPAEVRVSVGVDGKGPGDVKNFRQTLTFPVRVVRDQGVRALPYRPAFLLFEDPEYNRRLASTTAQQAAIVFVTQGANPPVAYNITLSADRHEYNPTGQIHYLFFFDPPLPDDINGQVAGNFQFRKINRRGEIKAIHSGPTQIPSNTLPDTPDQDLITIRSSEPADDPLVPGDTLVLTLTLQVIGAPAPPLALNAGPISLNLPIVAEPVTPVPEAGYALLRRNPDLRKNPDGSVECARFAFSPAAARIELMDPNDLRRQNVRRRASFRWRDTTRIGRACTYAIQKITTGGSTHFPLPAKIAPISPPGK